MTNNEHNKPDTKRDVELFAATKRFLTTLLTLVKRAFSQPAFFSTPPNPATNPLYNSKMEGCDVTVSYNQHQPGNETEKGHQRRFARKATHFPSHSWTCGKRNHYYGVFRKITPSAWMRFIVLATLFCLFVLILFLLWRESGERTGLSSYLLVYMCLLLYTPQTLSPGPSCMMNRRAPTEKMKDLFLYYNFFERE
jgi:hypothetical protein